MKPASSECRKSAALATSQAVPILARSGTLASRSAATSARLRLPTRARVSTAIGVFINPGRMTLARTPNGAFWIAPSAMPLDIGSGPVGTTFTVHLKGVGWSETANIYAVNYDNGYIGYACGFNSQGDVVVHLRATGAPGWHFIDLYPAIYKGKESRPVNFRLPQLTYAEDHPGEDLPRFSFAFEVTEPAVR